MPQGYQARKVTLQQGEEKKTVYTAVPYYFGTLTTEEMAEQISTESAMTKGDVMNVLDGIQRYIRTNLTKGYRIELLGLGVIFNRFTTAPAVSTAKEVTAKLIKAIVPRFPWRVHPQQWFVPLLVAGNQDVAAAHHHQRQYR